MKKNIYPSRIFGKVTAPVSKSVMQRALIAALLSNRPVVLHHVGYSNDDVFTTKMVEALGAKVEFLSEGSMRISSNFEQKTFNEKQTILSVGESGLAARMSAAILALVNHKFVVEGEGTLLKRNLGVPDNVFGELGARFATKSGRLPFRIKGPMEAKNITIESVIGSQFISGLLMAYSYLDASDVTIEVKDLRSKPYIDLTLRVMDDFGMKIPTNKDYKQFYFSKEEHTKPNALEVFEYTIERDWSNAAMLLVAGAVAGEIEVEGLDLDSNQGDKQILHVLQDVGAQLSIHSDYIKVKTAQLKAFHFDATECPDLFPPLVALAANCEGVSVIEGVERLKHKESNRARSLQYEFGRLGIKIEVVGNQMQITGGPISSAKVKSQNDHRVAMALAIAGLNAAGRVEIGDADAVNKSYPYFFADLESLHAEMD